MLKTELNSDIRDFENFRYDAERCIGCKGCAWVDHIYMPGVQFGVRCPSLERYSFDAYSSYGRCKIALAVMNGELEYSDRLLDIIYQCQLCGACDAGCKRNLDLEPLLLLEAMRVKCVQDGKGPMPAHKTIAGMIAEKKNRYGLPHKNRHNWIPEDVRAADKADILYFPGCAASYTHQQISQATARILNAAKTPFMVMDDWCCGNPLYCTGQMEPAMKQAEHNIEAIKKTGVSTVLTSCAECFKTLKVDYPKLFNKSTDDMGFKVIHLVEYVDQKLKEGALSMSNKIEMKVTYHDSCQLARLSEPWIHWEGKRGKYGITDPPKEYRRGSHGVYEPPREILRQIPGIELVEMTRVRENAWCCGAGGGVKDAYKDFAIWTAGERMEEVKVAGAEAIVSCCPYCKDNFNDAIDSRMENVKTYDISELISKAI